MLDTVSHILCFFSLNSYTKHKVGTVITSICPEGETEPKDTKRET